MSCCYLVLFICSLGTVNYSDGNYEHVASHANGHGDVIDIPFLRIRQNVYTLPGVFTAGFTSLYKYASLASDMEIKPKIPII